MANVADLVRDAQRGDRLAWDALVERFAGAVWAVARSYGLSRTEAADVCQVTWLRLEDHLSALEAPERIGAWLAKSACVESLRILGLAGPRVPVSEERVVDLRDPLGPTTAATGGPDELDERLLALLAGLPTRQQLVLRLLTADVPLSDQDVSEALDVPIDSIGPTLARYLEQFRQLADAAGVAAGDERL